jgi:hypothetical protein
MIPLRIGKPANAPMRFDTLQRKCACGGSASGGECEACKKKKAAPRRSSTSLAAPNLAPPIVHEVLRSSGQPLDAQTGAFMESRSGHDFSRVKLHADDKAKAPVRSQSALAISGLLRSDGLMPILFDGMKEVEAGHTDCDWDRSVKQDEPFIPKSGNPKVKIVTEDPCVRDCTVQHEAVHVNQLKPICKPYFECYTAAPAKAAASDTCKGMSGDDLKKCQGLVTQLLRGECFVAAGNAWDAQKWECEGYKTSLSCAQTLLSQAKPECQSKITEYRDSAKKQIDKYCKTAKEDSNKKQDGGSGQTPPSHPQQ